MLMVVKPWILTRFLIFVCVSERACDLVGVEITRFVEFRHLTNDMKRAWVPFVLLFMILMRETWQTIERDKLTRDKASALAKSPELSLKGELVGRGDVPVKVLFLYQ